jgi:hypothetical protein
VGEAVDFVDNLNSVLGVTVTDGDLAITVSTTAFIPDSDLMHLAEKVLPGNQSEPPLGHEGGVVGRAALLWGCQSTLIIDACLLRGRTR